jgi:hypothetical protein
MFVAERFLSLVVNKYGLLQISSDGETWYPPQECKFLKVDNHLHSSFEKRILIERTIQYIKDRTKFDDYFPSGLLHDYFFRHLITFC